MKKLISFAFFALLSISAHARLATLDDYGYKVLHHDCDLEVHADGTYKATYTRHIQILNESARQMQGVQAIFYNPSDTKINILKAETKLGQAILSVTEDKIEDQPVSSNPQGFDQMHRVLVAFPGVEIGAELILVHEETLRTPSMPELLSKLYTFGAEYYENGQLTVTSEVPLNIHINDPRKVLTTTQKDKFHFTAKLTKPDSIGYINEPDSFLSAEHQTMVTVSTFAESDWHKFGQTVQAGFETQLAESLPKLFETIRNKASGKENTLDKINVVTSELNESLRYFGDWRTRDGMFYPRALSVVAYERHADCKDFSTATVAILRKLGIEAYVALVKRSYDPYPSEIHHLPSFTHFNHAIVYVKQGDQALWIDPTNHVSMAGQIFPDIAGKKALVLSAEPFFATTPEVNPEDNQHVIQKTITFQPNGINQVDGFMTVTNQSAIEWTAASRFISKEQLETSLLSYVVKPNSAFNHVVKLPTLTSRIVEPLNFEYKLEQTDTHTLTNAGLGYTLQPYTLSSFSLNGNEIGDLSLGTPITNKRISVLKNVKPSGTRNLNQHIQSPWLDLSRVVTYHDDKIHVEHVFIVKKRIIENSVLKSPEFLELSRQIEQHFNQGIALVFEINE